MKRLVILPLILLASCVYGQLDNIEYNWWSQILKFEIIDNQYFFKTWSDSIIETDDLLFNSEKFFENFKEDEKHPDYIDSIEMVIASRTMKKSYLESPLLTNENSLRICWLKESQPIIFRILDLRSNTYKVNIKIGDGRFRWHGNLVLDSIAILSERNTKKLKKIINTSQLLNFSNIITVPNQIGWPNTFYTEIVCDNRYNTFIIRESNLMEEPCIEVFNVFQFLERKTKIKKVRPSYW